MTEEQKTKLKELNKKKQLAIINKGPALTKDEEVWMARAIEAQTAGTDLVEDPVLGEPLRKMIEPAIEPTKMAEVVKAATEDIDENEKLQKALAELSQDIKAELEARGLVEETKAAIAKHGQLYFQSIRGVLFGFKPLYYDDLPLVDQKLSNEAQAKRIVELCVVVNAKGIFNKPRMNTYATIYDLIMKVSDGSADLPFPVQIDSI